MLKNITNPPVIAGEPLPVLPNVMNEATKLYIHPTDNHAGIIWGCSGTAIGAQSTTDGSANTSAIIAGCATRPIAASVCDGLTFGGYSDWYLPTTGELTAIWNSCTGTKTNNCMNTAIDKGDYADDWVNITGFYWSSRESANNFFAYMVSMSNSEPYENPKTSSYSVRCVRKD